MAPLTLASGKIALDIGAFGTSAMAKAVQSLYGVVGSLNDFVDRHIASMEASPDESIARTGRVLQGAKQGLLLGYAAPVVLIAVGQLLLGNPLSAVGTVLSAVALANPVASTCAAVGAIWFGWKALSEAEQQALIAKLSEGFALAADVIRRVISFALDSLKSALSSKELAALKTFVIESAARVGRSVYAITGQLKDLIYSPENPADTEVMLVASPLLPVLKAMDRETELEPLLTTSCPGRCKSEPPYRPNSEPGMEAAGAGLRAVDEFSLRV